MTSRLRRFARDDGIMIGRDDMKVKDKVCVVTGAAGGIGEAVARRYAKEGAKGVVVADSTRSPQGRRRGHQRSRCRGRRRQGKRDQTAGCRGRGKYGPVDVFLSNAGIGHGGKEDATDKDWADSWAIHEMTHVYAARALVPGMLERKSGYLLNTASAAGLLASMGSAPYGVTKHAAVALAEHLSIQYGDRGIASRCSARRRSTPTCCAWRGHRGLGRRRAATPMPSPRP